MSQKITKLVENLVVPILDQQKLELVDIEYKKEGRNWFLRVFIDKENGAVDIEDCGKVSEGLSAELDRVDPIVNPYFLEVSSPGAERPLKSEKDIKKSIGKHVHIKTYEAIDGNKTFEGKLINFQDNNLKVEIGKKTIEIPYEKVANARLAIVF